MDNEKFFKSVLQDIVLKITTGIISKEEIEERVQNELELKDIWESNDILITDCYYSLKHMEEEKISIDEWKYFLECFNGYRQYNLADKKFFKSFM